MTKIKAITFDLWGTLLRSKNLNLHNKIRDYISVNLGEHFTSNLFRTNMSSEELIHYFKQLCGQSKAKHLHSMINKHVKNNVVEYSDIKYILNLQDNYKLAIISNASSNTFEYIKNWNYNKIFYPIILSYQYETIKPEKEIFEITAKKLKVKINEILHIGDSYYQDYIGPKEHNVNTLLLDRKNEHKDVKEKIKTFKQLENYLENLK